MLFDTHCHLNFSRFKGSVDEVIAAAQKVAVSYMVVPGTDLETSQKAVDIAQKHEHIYAAVGIHPHHVYDFTNASPDSSHPELVSGSRLRSNVSIEKTWIPDQIRDDIQVLEELLKHPKVVAVGEMGMDKHEYKDTKYRNYEVSEKFIGTQKLLLRKQIMLAVQHGKSAIFHNREAKEDLLPILAELWDRKLDGRSVFHCCEPDPALLQFAKDHGMYMGIDGDLTYTPEKQAFISQIPLEMLVLETDAPFLLPEPLRSEKKFPNKPENIPLIAEAVAKYMNRSVEEVEQETFANSKRLFNLE